MEKLTRKPAAVKPSKPHKDFPLFPHATRRWAKKVRGKLVYFGHWDDPHAALEKWLAEKDDLLAGRTPRVQPDGLVVGGPTGLASRFLTAKKQLVDTRELTPRSFADYFSTCERVVRVFGRDRLVIDLATDDFARLRKDIASTLGPVALGSEIQRVRVLFKYGYDAGLIDRPVRYGPTFKRPSKKTLRQERHTKGERMFEAAQLRQLIVKAGVPLRAMILLGINCGFGNNDCGTLPVSALDSDGAWIRFPRPKTAIQRRCPLWPETVVALRKAIAERPIAKDEDDDGLVFLTKYGQPWAKGREVAISQDEDGGFTVKGNRANPLSHETRKILVALKLYRPGLGFYALRHSFETIAGEAKDQVAVGHIMGHADGSMAAVYRERISDERLKAVTEHVRHWLLTDGRGKDEKEPEGGWTLA
jgi:integrase